MSNIKIICIDKKMLEVETSEGETMFNKSEEFCVFESKQ